MNEFQSYIVKNRISQLSMIFILIGISALICFIVTIIFPNLVNNFQAKIRLISFFLFFSCFVALILIFKFQLTKEYEVLSELKLNTTQIVLNNNVYRLSDIGKLAIDYDGYQGEWMGKNKNSGVKNKISFIHCDKLISYNFLVESKEQRSCLIQLFDTLYKSRYSFIENNTRTGRTYLMNNLNYNEIQKFKEKYSLNSIEF